MTRRPTSLPAHSQCMRLAFNDPTLSRDGYICEYGPTILTPVWRRNNGHTLSFFLIYEAHPSLSKPPLLRRDKIFANDLRGKFKFSECRSIYFHHSSAITTVMFRCVALHAKLYNERVQFIDPNRLGPTGSGRVTSVLWIYYFVETRH